MKERASITLRVPVSLNNQLREITRRKNYSINRTINYLLKQVLRPRSSRLPSVSTTQSPDSKSGDS